MNHKNQMTPTATTMITMLFAQKLTQLENVNSETDTFGIKVEYAPDTSVDSPIAMRQNIHHDQS